MMMSDLPPDLVEEVLSRIPATYLRRLRSTCKGWNVLLKDRRFTEKHFRKAAKQSLVLMLKEYQLCPMSVNLNVAPPSIEFKGQLGLKDSHCITQQVSILNVFHCDGLLLCTTEDNRLVVWNPCLGASWWIQHKTGYKIYTNIGLKDYSRFVLGYVNNNSCRSYKILRYRSGYHREDRFDEIYEFSSDSWRVLDDFDPKCFVPSNGVSLKGNAYWWAINRNGAYFFLLAFDFTTEKFRRFCVPPLKSPGGFITLSVVREEQLALSHQSLVPMSIVMWVTNKIDTEAALQWSIAFKVDVSCIPFGVNYPGFVSLVIDEEKNVAVCCNKGVKRSTSMVYIVGEDAKYYREIPYLECTNESWWLDKPYGISTYKPFVFYYVPSFVQVKQG